MKNKMKNFVWVLIIMLALTAGAKAAGSDYALLIQASPADGGTVTPGVGVHSIQIDQTVRMTAKPKKGYRFVYWLGDVSSTSGVDTTISVDSPKLVVAVFVREGFDGSLPDTGIIDGQIAGGGGGRFYNPVQSPGSASPTGGVADYDYPSYEIPEIDYPTTPDIPDTPDTPDTDDDISVPGDDIPVPGDNEVPEPATLFLMGIGSAILLKRKR